VGMNKDWSSSLEVYGKYRDFEDSEVLESIGKPREKKIRKGKIWSNSELLENP